MTRPFFSRNRISDFDNFERHTENTISTIKARLTQGYPIDFQVRKDTTPLRKYRLV